MTEVTLGGERLGGGKRNKVQMKGYERSTHDLSYIWRTTMSAGTLVPFMSQLALPGDTFDIDLDMNVMTSPTVGPLFGSYKVHADVFLCPIRLYNAMLHMNMLGIGMDMSKVYLPTVEIYGNVIDYTKPIDNQHMNPSCIFKYLGISGNGYTVTSASRRRFNAVPYLAYWDIYKQYYANKQEGIGAMVHTKAQPTVPVLASAQIYNSSPGTAIPVPPAAFSATTHYLNSTSYIVIIFNAGTLTSDFQISQLKFMQTSTTWVTGDTVFQNWTMDITNNRLIGEGYLRVSLTCGRLEINSSYPNFATTPKVYTFPLVNIDNMRTAILQAPAAIPYNIDFVNSVGAPYKTPLETYTVSVGPPVIYNYSNLFAQEGLALRTYQSDLFNNWIDTNTIDGANGITAVTSVNVVANKFTIDELNLSKKVYEMLNRIAISGGTYDDWLDAVYTHERQRGAENPMYMGGLLKNVVFQEVVSTASTWITPASGSPTELTPLGQLAGRGRLGDKHKGGKIVVKVDEPSYIIGIVSLVPNIDYSQGNQWDLNLTTLNDLHKPALDEIGFQNLITDQMAWFDTQMTGINTKTLRSAGKQPAWINYMTNVNKVYGNFADEGQQMFMVLNRRYDMTVSAGVTRINDLTTYIDPAKFNHIFADTRSDAMNFWVQMGVNIEARRKMSAKVIPNL